MGAPNQYHLTGDGISVSYYPDGQGPIIDGQGPLVLPTGTPTSSTRFRLSRST